MACSQGIHHQEETRVLTVKEEEEIKAWEDMEHLLAEAMIIK